MLILGQPNYFPNLIIEFHFVSFRQSVANLCQNLCHLWILVANGLPARVGMSAKAKFNLLFRVARSGEFRQIVP